MPLIRTNEEPEVCVWRVAFVLINAEVDAEREVFEVLKAIPGIKEAHMVYGVYDIIARVEAGPA